MDVVQYIEMTDQDTAYDGPDDFTTHPEGEIYLDTDKFDGSVSYYIEVVATNEDPTALARFGVWNENNDEETDLASRAEISVSQTTPKRARGSTSFTPDNTYKRKRWGCQSSPAGTCYEARLVVIQSGASKTEQQIALGANYDTKSTTYETFPDGQRKFWYYDRAKFDGDIIGYDGEPGTSVTVGNDNIYAIKFSSSKGLRIKNILARIGKSTYDANVKCAVYSDSAGYPDALLGYTSSIFVTHTSRIWRIFTITSGNAENDTVVIEANKDYWIAIWCDESITISSHTGSTNQRTYKTYTYNSFPDPYPATGTQGNQEFSLFAPHISPQFNFEALLSSSGATDIAYAAIKNVTDDYVLEDTEVEVTGKTITRQRIATPIQLKSGKEYEVVVKSSADNRYCYLESARIVIEQTDQYEGQVEGFTWYGLYGAYTRGGQKFTGSGRAIDYCEFYIKRVGSPTGTLYVRLRKWSDKSIVATSTGVDVSTISTSEHWHKFTFPDPPATEAGTVYCLCLEAEFTFSDVNNEIENENSSTAEHHPGNRVYTENSTWYEATGYDTKFRVWAAVEKTQIYLRCGWEFNGAANDFDVHHRIRYLNTQYSSPTTYFESTGYETATDVDDDACLGYDSSDSGIAGFSDHVGSYLNFGSTSPVRKRSSSITLTDHRCMARTKEADTYIGVAFLIIDVLGLPTGTIDRSLVLDVEASALVDRSLILDIGATATADRSLVLDVEFEDTVDRDLILDVEKEALVDRSLTLDVEFEDLVDRSLVLDIEKTETVDRSLTLDIEKIVTLDRSLILDVHFEADVDRSLILDVEKISLQDRDLILDIEFEGVVDRSLVLDVEHIETADRDLILDVHFEGEQDRDLILDVQFTVQLDRSLILDAEARGTVDRSLVLDIEKIELFDRSLILDAQFEADQDRDLILDIIFEAEQDRDLILDVEHTVTQDRSLILDVHREGLLDRSLVLDIAYTDTADRSLILDIEKIVEIDRALVLDVEHVSSIDRSLILDVHFEAELDRSLVLDAEAWAIVDRSLILDIAGVGFEDRSLVLDVEKIEQVDRDLILDVEKADLTDRSLVLDVEFEVSVDRDLILDIEHTVAVDRSFILDVHFEADQDRSLILDVDFEDLVDRSLVLDIESLGLEDRSLVLDIEKIVLEDRSLILDVELEALLDRSLILDIESVGLVDRSLILDIAATAYSDRSLILDVEHEAEQDRDLILDVEFEELADRSLILDIEKVFAEDRSLILDVEHLELIDRSLVLDIDYEGVEDRSLILNIDFAGIFDRGLVLDIVQWSTVDRSLVLDTIAHSVEDRSLILDVTLEKTSISGIVQEEDTTPIPGAVVIAIDEETKEIAATTISKPDGSFIMFVLKDKLFHVIAHTSQETVSGATAAHVYTVTT